MTNGKAEVGRVRLEKRRREKISEEKEKEHAGAGKGRKVAIHSVFSMVCRYEGSKSRLARAAGAEPSGQMRDEKLHAVGAKHIPKSKCAKHTNIGALLEAEMSKKCTSLWREAHFEANMYKTHHVRATFGRSELVLRGRRKGLRTFPKVSKT